MEEQIFNAYITKIDDTWDIIAKKTLGDELEMTRLLEFNREFARVTFFPDGIAIKIPETTKFNLEVKAPWMT